jgi:hypothetical protein
MNEKKTLFADEFTGKYELSKTLRFELKPVGNTQQMLEDNDVFETDKNLYKKYIAVKPYFDKLHREFVNEALSGFSLTHLDTYQKAFIEYNKDKKDKKLKAALEKEEKRLREEIVLQFDNTAEKWSKGRDYLKKKDTDIFFEAGIFQLLKEFYGSDPNTNVLDETDEKKNRTVSIFDQWGKFTGYFNKFHATRKNFYKSDGTSTALATRMIDQNLRRFVSNMLIFENSIKDAFDYSEIEKNFKKTCADIFSLDGYSGCLTQSGINIYNQILGGETQANGEKWRGINELVNEYRQKNTDKKLPFLVLLDKQILSEHSESFISGIQDANGLLGMLKVYLSNTVSSVAILRHIFSQISHENSGYDLTRIYISKESLNTILHKWVVNQEIVGKAFFEVVKKYKSEYELLNSGRKGASKIEEKEGDFSFPDFIKLSHIQEALLDFSNEDNIWKGKYYKNTETGDSGCIERGDDSIEKQFLSIFRYEFQEIAKEYDKFLPKFQEIINRDLLRDNEIDQEFKIAVKDFFDTVKYAYQMGKYFAIEKKRVWLDNYDLCDSFYKEAENGYLVFYENAFDQLVRPYDDVRNYLTKKPYSEEKWKLNFENDKLASGWDKNKEPDNSAIILKKAGLYYLGIMRKGNGKLFDEIANPNLGKNLENGSYQKMLYKFFPEASKMIPKCSTQLKLVQKHFSEDVQDYKLFTKKDFIGEVLISKKVYELNNHYYYKDNIDKFFIPATEKEKVNGVKMFQKGFIKNGGSSDLFRDALNEWIGFCKQFLKAYKSTSIFDYSQLKENSEYASLDEFYNDINKLTYSVSFTPISQRYIEEKNETGELYLFNIHNKDWNLKNDQEKTGSKNLHTVYFESVFSDENARQGFVFKLNGQAELFFRPATDKSKLGFKKDQNGNDVINHKRYASNKVFFHVPVAVNREKNKTSQFQFNLQTNEFLKNNAAINIIGIDRGEKHLAYYSVINQKGEIIETGSLNNPFGKVDYHKLLEEKAKSREASRKDWSEVEKIKDLKKGYISQVVRKIADLIIEHNAIVVFEDLNMRFKQVRGGIEKSVYQQLEKALIDKLSFLVKKGEQDSEKAGHLLRAYQLAAPFSTFKEMGKQTGIIFYTQAEYTSTTDPVTGFRKNVYISNSATQDKIIKAIRQFDAIGWDEHQKSYFFTYTPISFVEKKFSEKTFDKKWTIHANVPRIAGHKNSMGKWESKTLNPNTMLQQLLEGWEIAQAGERVLDLKSAILSNIEKLKGEQKDIFKNGKKRNFLSDFIYIFNLILQVRNSFSKSALKDKDGNLQVDEEGRVVYEGEDIDLIASPVYPFFTTASSKSEAKFTDFEKMFIGTNEGKEKFLKEFNGDANGAYNIARKGIMILKRLENDAGLQKDGLYIHKHQWDEFASSMYSK